MLNLEKPCPTPISVKQSFEMNFKVYSVSRVATITASIYDIGKAGTVQGKAKLTLMGDDGKPVATKEFAVDGKLPATVDWHVPGLTNEKTYSVEGRARLTQMDGFRVPKRPEWADSTAGEPGDMVLKPWTPIVRGMGRQNAGAGATPSARGCCSIRSLTRSGTSWRTRSGWWQAAEATK